MTGEERCLRTSSASWERDSWWGKKSPQLLDTNDGDFLLAMPGLILYNSNKFFPQTFFGNYRRK